MTKKAIEECKKNYERNNTIPADEYKEFVILQSKSSSAWEEAKEKSDFSIVSTLFRTNCYLYKKLH